MKKGNGIYIMGILSLLLIGQIQCEAKEILYVDPSNPYLTTSSRYNHIYANPPKQRFGGYGYHHFSTSRIKTRYVHSPSKLKGARHAARINAYNYDSYNSTYY